MALKSQLCKGTIDIAVNSRFNLTFPLNSSEGENVRLKEKKVLGLTIGSHSLVHFYEGVLPPLFPLLLAEFTTDYFHLGVIVSIFSYAFGFGSLPAGLLADKIGSRKLISIYLFGAGLLAVLVWPANTLWFYGTVMGLVGLFCAIYHPAANTLLSLAMTDKGNAFGLHGVAGSLGVALTPILSAWSGTLLGWRTPHVIFGLMGILLGLYSLVIPEYRPPRNDSADKIDGVKLSHNQVTKILVFFAASIFTGLTYKGIMTFLPAFMGEQVRLSFLPSDPVALGGTVATIALLVGAAGQFASGRMVDRIRPEKLYLIAILISTASVFAIATSANLALIAATIVYAFFYFSIQPVQNFLITTYLPPHRRGFGFGLHFFLSFGVGATAAPVCGYLADTLGLASVFWAMGISFIISAVLSWMLLVQSSRDTA